MVWGTVIVTLTNMVVQSIIAGGLYTNIEICVELNRVSLRFVTSQGPHRACIAPKTFLLESFDTNCRVSYYATSPFILSIPADFPAPPPRSVTSKRQLGRTSHMQRRRHPRIARAEVPGLLIPLHLMIPTLSECFFTILTSIYSSQTYYPSMYVTVYPA